MTELHGVHTCQSGPGKGQSFVIADEHGWSCPLCHDHGPGINDQEVVRRDVEFGEFVIDLMHEELSRRLGLEAT